MDDKREKYLEVGLQILNKEEEELLTVLIPYVKSERGKIHRCPICKQLFTTHRRYKKQFCIVCTSIEKKKFYTRNKYPCICKACGKEFVAPRKSASYCSRECYLSIHKDKPNPYYKRSGQQVKCQACGKSFLQVKVTQTYCS